MIGKKCFRRGGNVFFTIFRFSAVAETLILPISAFPPWRKRIFYRFPFFRRGGSVDFAVFCISSVGETSFLPFSARPSPRTDKNREIWH